MGGDDVGDDVHDDGGECIIIDETLDELLDGSYFLINGAVGYFGFDFFKIGRVVISLDKERADTHIITLCV